MCLISWQHSQGGRTQHPGSDCERDPQEFQSWTQERKVNKCIRVILIPRWQRALNTEGCSVHNKSHSFNRVPFSCSSEMGEDALELSNCFPFFGWVYPTLPRVLAGWSEKRNITWGLTSCNITFSFRAPNISHKNISDVTTIHRSGVVEYVPFLCWQHLSDASSSRSSWFWLTKWNSSCFLCLSCQGWPLARLELVLSELSEVA